MVLALPSAGGIGPITTKEEERLKCDARQVNLSLPSRAPKTVATKDIGESSESSLHGGDTVISTDDDRISDSESATKIRQKKLDFERTEKRRSTDLAKAAACTLLSLNGSEDLQVGTTCMNT